MFLLPSGGITSLQHIFLDLEHLFFFKSVEEQRQLFTQEEPPFFPNTRWGFRTVQREEASITLPVKTARALIRNLSTRLQRKL